MKLILALIYFLAGFVAWAQPVQESAIVSEILIHLDLEESHECDCVIVYSNNPITEFDIAGIQDELRDFLGSDFEQLEMRLKERELELFDENAAKWSKGVSIVRGSTLDGMLIELTFMPFGLIYFRVSSNGTMYLNAEGSYFGGVLGIEQDTVQVIGFSEYAW